MFGFGKKKIKKPEKMLKNIQVIPEEFYGAKDPVIHYKETVKKHSIPQSKDGLFKQNQVSKGRVGKIFKNKKFIYIAVAIFSVIALSLISWYYINKATKELNPKADLTSVENNLNNVLPKETEIATEEKKISADETALESNIIVIEEEVPTTTPSLQKKKILEFPQTFLIDSPDVDNDKLTDLEEEIFDIDSGNWDTDGDGYYDGQEVVNLYNPKGIAPMKLIDAGLIQEYVNSTWQYRVYYPLKWMIGEVDSSLDQVLFSSVTGDFVEIVVLEKDKQESFENWFVKEAKDQRFGDLQKITNRFKQDGWQRKDGLVAYFVEDTRIYVMLYHPGFGDSIPFRNIMQMMLQSFRPNKTIISIPDQVILPLEIQPLEAEPLIEQDELFPITSTTTATTS